MRDPKLKQGCLQRQHPLHVQRCWVHGLWTLALVGAAPVITDTAARRADCLLRAHIVGPCGRLLVIHVQSVLTEPAPHAQAVVANYLD
eukprot:366444-Chlamydomonas_euryale.AAC.30